MLGFNNKILRHNQKWIDSTLETYPGDKKISYMQFEPPVSFKSDDTYAYGPMPKSAYVKIEPMGMANPKNGQLALETSMYSHEQPDGTTVTYGKCYYYELPLDWGKYNPEYSDGRTWYNNISPSDYKALSTTGITLTARDGFAIGGICLGFWNGYGRYSMPRRVQCTVQYIGKQHELLYPTPSSTPYDEMSWWGSCRINNEGLIVVDNWTKVTIPDLVTDNPGPVTHIYDFSPLF